MMKKTPVKTSFFVLSGAESLSSMASVIVSMNGPHRSPAEMTKGELLLVCHRFFSLFFFFLFFFFFSHSFNPNSQSRRRLLFLRGMRT